MVLVVSSISPDVTVMDPAAAVQGFPIPSSASRLTTGVRSSSTMNECMSR